MAYNFNYNFAYHYSKNYTALKYISKLVVIKVVAINMANYLRVVSP